ncbi:immunity 8 family protein [Cellulomonas sp. SLBN-39]|uniref:immunity 8 family protein n=1 Tax=Cellulomonas sp. SLBN-39 TaxID=2768446 RepID=UPI00116AA36E|nr:immunity 8 family protein [Cellulomonas sp. SLBN-39]TQL02729.1 immunity protein 8 of polymorphic toxin system [Cellulomonas sp. SLBN-39]
MRAEIRSIFSSDVQSLEDFRPPEDAFAIPIRLQIGPAGQDGEESFDFTVCSAAWLNKQVEQMPVFDARHHLVVRDFHWAVIRRYIEGRVSRCVGKDWEELAQQLSRFAYWEFEDYS